VSGGDSETIGNSDTIIAHFITEYRLTIDATLTAAQRDMSHLMLLREVGESDRLAQRGPFAGAAQYTRTVLAARKPRSSRSVTDEASSAPLGIWIPKDFAQSPREIPLVELRHNRTSI
jgi:hypothetical protein